MGLSERCLELQERRCRAYNQAEREKEGPIRGERSPNVCFDVTVVDPLEENKESRRRTAEVAGQRPWLATLSVKA